MTAEASRLSPSLINAVNRIIAIYHMVDGINLYIPLSLVTVRIDDQMHQLILVGCDTEDGSMAQCRELCLEMFLLEVNGIVMRMGYFIIMTERRGTLLWLKTQVTTQCSYGKGTVILRTASHYPMAVAETLQVGILIIIRCNTFLFGILCLRRPEVLSVRNEDSRKGLSMFLATLAKHAGSLGIRLCCTHHCIEGIELADMFQIVDAFVHHLLPCIPGIITSTVFYLSKTTELDIPLIEHKLEKDRILSILIKYHLQVGSHRNHTVHPVYPITQDHLFLILSGTLRKRSRIEKERQETVKSRIVTKAKGCGRTGRTQCCISLSLDILPERDGTACRNRLVGRVVAIIDGHATVVSIIDSPELLICKQRIQSVFYILRISREIQAYILNRRSHRMHLSHQLQGFIYLRDILK